MKRLISVLAIALILTMMSWGTANSVDAPVKLKRVQYDHPWYLHLQIHFSLTIIFEYTITIKYTRENGCHNIYNYEIL